MYYVSWVLKYRQGFKKIEMTELRNIRDKDRRTKVGEVFNLLTAEINICALMEQEERSWGED